MMLATSMSQEELFNLLQSSIIGPGNVAASVYQLSKSKVQGGNSILYRAKLKNFPTDLAVKLCLPQNQSTCSRESLSEFGLSVESAMKQKDDLLALQHLFSGDPDYGVPKVYDYLTDHGILVSEWVEGRSLRELLLDWRLSPRKKLELIERTGIWLRRYHDSQSLEEGRLDCEAILQNLRQNVSRAGPDFSDNPIVREALDCLTRSVAEVSVLTIPRAWIQGDVHSGNIMVSGSRICGIDISISYENVIVRDLAPFLNQMILLAYRPEGFRLLLWRERMVEAFLAGYCHDGLVVSRLALIWMRLSSILIVWMDQMCGWRSSVKRYYLNLVFGDLTDRLTKQLLTL